MEILETKRGKSGVQSIVVRCGEYTAELTFCENCETDVMIPIKELIMSAYDLRKQREEQDNRVELQSTLAAVLLRFGE